MPWTDRTPEALASGALPNLDTVLPVRRGTSEDSGMRTVDLAPAGGIAVRVLPDRGLDLGAASFNGVPLSWTSSVGEVGPLAELDGMAWGDAFGGGLLTTCGLRNVGMPSGGHGLHGTYSHLPASDIRVERDADVGTVRVSGTVIDDAVPGPVAVERTITNHAGHGRVEVSDTTTNHASEAVILPILYHVNLGWPLWSDAARLGMPVRSTVVRDPESEPALDRWRTVPPLEDGPEWVLEHIPADDDDGWASAAVTNPDLGLRLTLTWQTATLPIVNQWLDRRPGMAVLGIEPANCTTRGIAHELASGTAPILGPGRQRTTGITIECEAI